MTLRKALIEIIREEGRGKTDYQIRIGQPGWQQGDSVLAYQLGFTAQGYENISMEGGSQFPGAPYDEWPPTLIGPQKYALVGDTGNPASDAFRVTVCHDISIAVLPTVPGHDTRLMDVVFETADSSGRIITARTLASNVSKYIFIGAGLPLGKILVGAGLLAGLIAFIKAKK